MIKFSQLLTEIGEQLAKELSDTGVSLLSKDEWDKDGGYWISTGGQHRLYTLRHDWNESYQFGEIGASGQRQTGTTRKSYWVINIAKSWAETLKKLPALLKKYEIKKIYIPDYDADLDPNATARDIVFDENGPMIVGKKHEGKTVGWVKENDPSYLVYLATHISSGSYETKKFIEFLKVYMAEDIKKQEESLTGDAAIPFGKYKGQKLSDIAKVNVGYIKWLANSDSDDRGYTPHDDQGKLLQQAARKFAEGSSEVAQAKSVEEDRARRFAPLVEFMKERVQSAKEWEQNDPYSEGGFSDFLQQLTNQLAKGQIPRGKAAEIVIDNYGKWFGGKARRGTKEYNRRREEFIEKYVKGEEAAWGF